MVDFTLSDEQKALRELAHDFAEKEIRPVAWEFDKDGTWPQAIIDKATPHRSSPGHTRRMTALLPIGTDPRAPDA